VIGVASGITVVTLTNGAKQCDHKDATLTGASVVYVSKMPDSFITVTSISPFRAQETSRLDDYKAILSGVYILRIGPGLRAT